MFNVLIEKEYYELDKNKKESIGLVMMVKNEHKRIQVSLDSVVGFVDCACSNPPNSTANKVEIAAPNSKEPAVWYMLKLVLISDI